MYTLEKLIKGAKNWELIREEIPNVPFKLHNWIMRKIVGNGGIDLMAADWDNLVILDACRYDVFERYCRIDGNLKAVISPGSSTTEFVRRSFQDREFPDTVYVSGNAQLQKCGCTDNFYAFERVWIDGWDETLFTVRPDTMAEAAIAAEERFPKKRLIIHMVQPHYPFIGPKGRDIDHRGFTLDGTVEEAAKHKSIWNLLRHGEVSEVEVREAYVENLLLTLPHVEQLCDSLTGKTVVTADHGNVFGKWFQYGHPRNRFLEELVKVPWLETEHEERKRITTGDMSDHTVEPSDDSTVEDRLEALGYTE